ncbi:hypothetical protein PENTCL1PPCAC_22685 [Pristionchus entomophagus]|uniref:DNA topoisomerase I eukaryotic-type domain-containing protein n=1 Tax=Pristionchus entomophagus TaxID=358040 RepID=A0AAV5U1X9_9BILA|nr:hypothetical protein PENTCL1PPCAC_22685 [Pristionchus entomophagus]
MAEVAQPHSMDHQHSDYSNGERYICFNQWEEESDSEDEIPWSQRMKDDEKKNGSSSSKRSVKKEESESEEDYKPPVKKDRKEKEDKKKKKKEKEKEKKSSSKDKGRMTSESPVKRKKKDEEQEEVWEWWKEDKKPAGVKWNSLSHKGPLFAPPYERLPKNVHFKYNGEVIHLSENAEEIAGFYGRMLDHEYTSNPIFNKNFFHDWRKSMTPAEREKITELKNCDFRQMDVYYKEQTEKRKAMTKEEKLAIKGEKEGELKIYGFAYIDGHKQKVANFRIEPPDVIINCSKDSEIPPAPPGHKWKEVRHDNTVTWLVSWTETVLGQNKYIMLNPSSKIKGEKDYEKYETARRLKNMVGNIRDVYTQDFKSKEMRVRQRAVALYFIDKLALRAGNEKDTDEGCRHSWLLLPPL